MAIDPAIAYNTLVANPGEFLKRYAIRIFGATAASGQANYVMVNRVGAASRPGSILGTLHMHGTESFEIRAQAVAVGLVGKLFVAHSIHMDVGAAAMGFYRLGPLGPNIMLTGQLSGCSFVMLPVGPGQLDVAHVQPQGQTGQALYGQVTGALPNALVYGASGTSGNYDSVDRRASIVGVRGGNGEWRIFAQKTNLPVAGAGANPSFGVKSVYQIYPDRQKLS